MPRQGTKLKNRSTKRTELESYLFRIMQTQPHYGFGVNFTKGDDESWSEFLHHQFATICLAPCKYADRRTQFTTIGNRGLLGGNHQTPRAIGTLTIRGDRSEYLGSLPFDAAQSLPILALLDGYRFIQLSGDQAKRGTAQIRHIGFYREFDLDELW